MMGQCALQPEGAHNRRLNMTITKTSIIAGLIVASLTGPVMAQEGPDPGQAYWADRMAAAKVASPNQGGVQRQPMFFNRSQSVRPDVPSVGGGEG
jgi:hypothetical protein